MKHVASDENTSLPTQMAVLYSFQARRPASSLKLRIQILGFSAMGGS